MTRKPHQMLAGQQPIENYHFWKKNLFAPRVSQTAVNGVIRLILLMRVVLPRLGWSRLEPSAAPSSAELQPSCGDLSEPGSELADPGWRWLEPGSAVAAEFIPS